MNSVSPMNFFRTTDTTDMFGHQMGSDKVCEGCFFIHLDEFGQFSLFWLCSLVQRRAKKLDELSFVVRIGRSTTKDGIKTANGVNTEQFNA